MLESKQTKTKKLNQNWIIINGLIKIGFNKVFKKQKMNFSIFFNFFCFFFFFFFEETLLNFEK